AASRLEIAVLDVHDAFDLSEALSVLRRPGHRERAHRAAVERVVVGDDARARLAFRVEPSPRELEERLVRLRAGVAEEGAVEAASLAELLREEDVLLVVEIVGDVNELRRLLGDGRRQAWMRMPDGAHRDARAEVEPPPPFDVEDLASLSAREDHRRGFVVRIE